LNFIQHDWVSNAKKFNAHQSSKMANISLVRIENGVLIVNDGRYHIGDRIVITTEHSDESFNGTMTSINSCEMYCRLIDGSKARIYLKRLRNGRVSIALEKQPFGR
jgi:hypothetical protein